MITHETLETLFFALGLMTAALLVLELYDGHRRRNRAGGHHGR